RRPIWMMRSVCSPRTSVKPSWIDWPRSLCAGWLFPAAEVFAKYALVLARAARVAALGLYICSRSGPAGPYSGGFRQERESRPLRCGTQCAGEHGWRDGRRLPEVKVTKTAFDKIKAGLEDAKAYLDGSANKRHFRIHVPARV